MMVVYEGDGEVLIIEAKNEKDLIKGYFTKGGRDIEKYDRSESSSVIEVTSRMTVET